MGLSGGCGFGWAACRHQSGRTHQADDLAPEPGTYLRVEPVLFATLADALVRFAGKAPVAVTREDDVREQRPSTRRPNASCILVAKSGWADDVCADRRRV